ncbi:MAG TPA: hypothetical protein VHH72_07000 [Solirubrobacterales bacterium]|jgi:hypothetical protein|nr:hypothetical protein [Solirubrobacterales bacterium]
MRFMPGALAAATVVLLLAACGGGDGGAGDSGGAAEIPGDADPEAARVIDEWSSALREGDVATAADYFEVPSVAQNGTPPLQLSTREQVIAFNEALPCGAKLTEAEAVGRFTIASFELTERPGEGECGSGTGNTAKTAFVIEDGLIIEWVRVVNTDEAPSSADEPIV